MKMRTTLKLDEAQCEILERHGDALLEHVKTHDPKAALVHNQAYFDRLQFWTAIGSPELEQRLGKLGYAFDNDGNPCQDIYTLKFYPMLDSKLGYCEYVNFGIGHHLLKHALALAFDLAPKQSHWPNVRTFGELYDHRIIKPAQAQLLARSHALDQTSMESLQKGNVLDTPLLTALFTEVVLYDDPINSRTDFKKEKYFRKDRVI